MHSSLTPRYDTAAHIAQFIIESPLVLSTHTPWVYRTHGTLGNDTWECCNVLTLFLIRHLVRFDTHDVMFAEKLSDS